MAIKVGLPGLLDSHWVMEVSLLEKGGGRGKAGNKRDLCTSPRNDVGKSEMSRAMLWFVSKTSVVELPSTIEFYPQIRTLPPLSPMSQMM